MFIPPFFFDFNALTWVLGIDLDLHCLQGENLLDSAIIPAPDAVSHIPCGDPREPLRLEMIHYKRRQPPPAGRACLSCVPVTVCSEHASEIAEASEF